MTSKNYTAVSNHTIIFVSKIMQLLVCTVLSLAKNLFKKPMRIRNYAVNVESYATRFLSAGLLLCLP